MVSLAWLMWAETAKAQNLLIFTGDRELMRVDVNSGAFTTTNISGLSPTDRISGVQRSVYWTTTNSSGLEHRIYLTSFDQNALEYRLHRVTLNAGSATLAPPCTLEGGNWPWSPNADLTEHIRRFDGVIGSNSSYDFMLDVAGERYSNVSCTTTNPPPIPDSFQLPPAGGSTVGSVVRGHDVYVLRQNSSQLILSRVKINDASGPGAWQIQQTWNVTDLASGQVLGMTIDCSGRLWAYVNRIGSCIGHGWGDLLVASTDETIGSPALTLRTRFDVGDWLNGGVGCLAFGRSYLLFEDPCEPAQTVCHGAFAGGAIPALGTGGNGVYPVTLPGSPSVLTGTVAAPTGVLKSVKLNGLTHTWGGDVQMFIESPAQPGVLHSLFCLMPADPNVDWINNNYEIVDPVANPTTPLFNQGAGSALPNGTYGQFFNGFAGPANAANTPLETIPVGAGTWTLHAYDWVAGDSGSLTSWELCFGPPATVPPPPTPTLLAPANASTVFNPVTLTWSTVASASSYDVDLDGVLFNVAGSSFVAPMLAAGPHTWRVRAKNSGGSSVFTASFTFTVPVSCGAGTCVTGGVGSTIPGTGAADGVWPTTLPLGPMVSTASITTPAGATSLRSVRLLGLTHTWRSDVMVVLTAPNGSRHIIYAEDNSVNCGGAAVQYGGDYAFVDSTSCNPANGNLLTAASPAPSGEYAQAFGGWPNGNAGLLTTPISAIPVSPGTNSWTLTVYDWCTGFDNGGLVGFDLCFAAPTGPTSYCTAGTSTNGCNATISGSANPNAANTTQVTINVANVEGQKQGIYFYGINNTGFTPSPWSPGSTSFLCVKGPTQRASSQASGGTINACDGAFSLSWHDFVAANPTAVGVPFGAGDKVFVQAWYRDPPAPKTTNLSNAIEMTVQP